MSTLEVHVWGPLLSVLFMGLAFGCTAERKEPQFVGTLTVPAERYVAVVGDFDAALAPLGLRRYAAAPGLNELKGREVLYFHYRIGERDKWAFVTGTDLFRVGEIRVDIYPEALAPADRARALEKVQSVLAKYGATVKPFQPWNKQ